jgi:tetratricopeptide (TPR) repeat protein
MPRLFWGTVSAMPWGFRKRFSLGPGVRLNVGKTGFSVTVGNRFARTTLGSSGRVTNSYSLPGTGLYYTTTSGDQRTPGSQRHGSKAEASYAAAMTSFLEQDLSSAYDGFKKSAKQGADRISAQYYAAQCAILLGRMPESIPYLEQVVASEKLLPDDWMLTYAPPDFVQLKVQISIVDEIYATLDVSNLAAALQLAEMYQRVAGRRDDAIALMSEILDLDPSNEAVRLSLCDLLYEAADFGGVIAVAEQTSPRSSLGLACHVFKQQAYSYTGDHQAAKDAIERALSETEADDEAVLSVARSNLLGVYLDNGLSQKRAEAFQKALSKRKPAASDPRISHTVVMSSPAWEPGGDDDLYDPRANPARPEADL